MMRKVILPSEEIKKLNDAEKNHKNIFIVITDINGDKYLIAHGKGGFIFGDDGIGRTVDQAYERCLKKGYIKDGEHLHIACCFGAELSHDNVNVNIINNEYSELFIMRQVLNNGNGRLIMYTKKKLIDRVAAKVAAFC